MIKLMWRFMLLVAAALAFTWLADRPEKIVISSPLREIQMSLLVGVVSLCLALAMAYFVWRLLTRIWRSPSAVRESLRFRRHRKAYESLSRGIIAAGAGDAQAAARHATVAGDTLKNEPLVALLSAQAAQLKGDREGVKRAFEGMAQSEETELLGLRGLFADAKQAGDWVAARNFAERALAKNPRLPWASMAILQVQTAAKDWSAAAATIAKQGKAGLIARDEAAKKQAILLTAQALAIEDKDRDRAQAFAHDALSHDANLVPAALVAARSHIAGGNVRKALKVLKTTYAASPHFELAELAGLAKTSDTPEDRFERVRDLVGPPEANTESGFALARAAIAAKRWDVARAALESFMAHQPQARMCGLMAQIEDAQGDHARSREWLAKALNAPRDPIWVADGVASALWSPVSPITGEVVACLWKPPFDQPSGTALQFDGAMTAPQIATEKPKVLTLEKLRAPDDPGIDEQELKS
ncbi:MAG: heme biosynthesis protein HemY [Alphaproteobacteria bacterium]|nr:heme biosynthesis protein HemY [Alphaproteobacteria bacterium]